MSLRDSVDELYKFRDNYFEHHSSELADKKIEELTSELNKTLSLFNAEKEIEEDAVNKAKLNILKAKALNVLPEFNSEALDILTKIVKFHPKLTEAWNELGTCFYKKGDVKAAKSCFESALKDKKDAEALRNLSMILRQTGSTPEERLEKIHESLEKAKEAVNLNIQDGKSWYVLANAYQSLYFATDQNPNLLKQSLSSYSQAFADTSIKCNPDLYYNWAMAQKYDENYRFALENFEKALKYDPLWSLPKEQLEALLKHLENIQLLVSKKGKLKPRKLKEMSSSLKKELASLNSSEKHIDLYGKEVTYERNKFCDLQTGVNAQKVLRGKVICQVYCTDSPTYTFCMMDEGESYFAVNVYNMNQERGVIIGDSIGIFQPFVQHFNFTFNNKVFSFSSVRVNSPLHLEVNKKKCGREMIAIPRVSISLQSD